MHSHHFLARLTAITAIALASTGLAQAQIVHLPNDTTIDYPIPQIVRVGFANATDFATRSNPTSPTITILPGGDILSYRTYNNSITNMSGGSIAELVQTSTASTLNISGGTIVSLLHARLNSTLNISGGTLGTIFGSGTFLFETSTANVSGGTISGMVVGSFSTANISGGNFTSIVRSEDHGIVNFSGGSIAGRLETGTFSTTTVSGGSIGEDFILDGIGVGNLRGGNIAGNLVARYSSILNIYGNNLSAVLLPPNGGFDDQYVLSGSLLDGTSVDGKLVIANGGRSGGIPAATLNLINVVPEPGSISMLFGGSILGGLVLLRRRRK